MRTVHIFVLSDRKDDVDALRSLLESDDGEDLRFHVESSDNPTSSLRLFVSNKYDVYLLDQIVPGSALTSADYAKKAIAGGCSAPILLLTSLPDEDVDPIVRDAGLHGRINKNLDMDKRNIQNILITSMQHNFEVSDILQQLTDLVVKVSGLVHTLSVRK